MEEAKEGDEVEVRYTGIRVPALNGIHVRDAYGKRHAYDRGDKVSITPAKPEEDSGARFVREKNHALTVLLNRMVTDLKHARDAGGVMTGDHSGPLNNLKDAGEARVAAGRLLAAVNALQETAQEIDSAIYAIQDTLPAKPKSWPPRPGDTWEVNDVPYAVRQSVHRNYVVVEQAVKADSPARYYSDLPNLASNTLDAFAALNPVLKYRWGGES